MIDYQQRARELIAAECLDRAVVLEKRAETDRETGDSIQEAIDNEEGVTPDEPQDVAAGLFHDADSAEMTAGLLRKAHAALCAAPEVPAARVTEPLRADEPRQEQADAAIYNRGWNDCRTAMLAARPQGVKDA